MAQPKHFDFNEEVSRLLPLIIREATSRQSTIFARGGMTIPQIVIMDLLREKGPRKMSESADALHLTMSAVTAIVDKMIMVGLVKRERSKADRRVVYISLRKKGKETIKKVSDERRKVTAGMFAALTRSEKKEYLRLLKKVYENLRKR